MRDTLVAINDSERNYLEKNGCKFPNDLHKTVASGKKKTIYATESKKVLDLLAQYYHKG